MHLLSFCVFIYFISAALLNKQYFSDNVLVYILLLYHHMGAFNGKGVQCLSLVFFLASVWVEKPVLCQHTDVMWECSGLCAEFWNAFCWESAVSTNCGLLAWVGRWHIGPLHLNYTNNKDSPYSMLTGNKIFSISFACF